MSTVLRRLRDDSRDLLRLRISLGRGRVPPAWSSPIAQSGSASWLAVEIAQARIPTVTAEAPVMTTAAMAL